MSGSEAKDNKRRGDKEVPPTAGFGVEGRGPGGRIGQFRIESELGRGGMGVVYLAHDMKLDRQVAIKSLPAELMDNPKARSRFSREARLLASLNHPNIATIYEELEEGEGAGFLVLEYVPGETLAERMGRKKLKVEEALTIGLQIADAVSAAHEKGVIHRDLKSGNIKITLENKVKVLDFGLARAVGSETLDEQSTITEPGRIIGTPAYMSPEQARGEKTDERSDIWSFGCVLYEMLTGKVPFEGGTPSDTLAGIIEREPDWQALPEATPANISVLLRRCLTKEPHRRLQHMGDASIEISETLNLPATAPPVTATSLEVSRPRVPRQVLVWGATFLIVVVVVTSLITWNLKRPPPLSPPLSQPARRYIIHPETDLAQEALWHHALALSPDGRRLAYVEEDRDARRKIYLRELDEFEAKPLPGTEGAISPFFSPNGEWIGYVDHHQRKLKKVPVKEGQPIVLCESVQFRGGTWGIHDTIIFTPAASGLWRISASAEGMERLTFPDPNKGERGHLWPQILPGGRAVLFTNERGGLVKNQFEVYRLETGERHVLFKGGTYARYVPTGHIVYARKDTLYAIQFDVERLKVVGSGVPVVPNVVTLEGRSWSAQYAIAQDGMLAYIPLVTRSTELTPVWVDRNGRVEALPAAIPREYDSIEISPDGRQVAFGIVDGGNRDVWIYDLMRNTLNPLTSNGISDCPTWTPESKWVVFRSNPAGKFQLFRQSVTGTEEPELLATFEEIGGSVRPCWPMCCSPDGKELLLGIHDPNNPRWDDDISVLPFENRNEKTHLRPFIQRNNNQRLGVWFSDGRWIAYSSDESGRWEVYVEPYPGPGPKTMISATGGYRPAWSRDGRELFYRGGRGSPKMIVATIEVEPEFRVIEYKELFETINFRNYDVAPDGRFLMIQEPREPTSLSVNIVTNWFEELKRLVPTGKD